MSVIYLSPSTQSGNIYSTGDNKPDNINNEEYYMNIIADEMVPYFLANGIQFSRNDREMTVQQAVSDSNSGNYALHVALHSNASPENYNGVLQGPNIFYYPGSESGQLAAILMAEQFAEIYPNPELIAVFPNDTLVELSDTKAPTVFVEVAYHDNEQDAQWIVENTQQIARAVSNAIANYLELPFNEPSEFIFGEVVVTNGNLNVRSAPSTRSSIIGKLANEQIVVILREIPGWYLVSAGGLTGYVNSDYITKLQ